MDGDRLGLPVETPANLALLAIFYARAHRRLYVPQRVGSLGETLGLSAEETTGFARDLQDRGYLREITALGEGGSLMEITPEGVSAVHTAYAPSALGGPS